MLSNYGVGEDSWESLGLQEIKPFSPKGNQSWIFIGRTNTAAEIPNTLATWCEEMTHWKRPCCWDRLKAGGVGDDRGWDDWMASPTPLTWVWKSFRSWWWTGMPGVLQSMGLQIVGYDWATEVNWTWYFLKVSLWLSTWLVFINDSYFEKVCMVCSW